MKASTIILEEIASNERLWKHAQALYQNDSITFETYNQLSFMYKSQIQTLDRVLKSFRESDIQ